MAAPLGSVRVSIVAYAGECIARRKLRIYSGSAEPAAAAGLVPVAVAFSGVFSGK
jgi:hypothetical protein